MHVCEHMHVICIMQGCSSLMQVVQLELLRDRRRFTASATDGTVLIYEHGLVPQ